MCQCVNLQTQFILIPLSGRMSSRGNSVVLITFVIVRARRTSGAVRYSVELHNVNVQSTAVDAQVPDSSRRYWRAG